MSPSPPAPDGLAYPSVRTIYRPEPSAPSAPPAPRPGVDWRNTVEVRDFEDTPEQLRREEPTFVPFMTLRTHLRVLRWVGLAVCAVQIAAAAAIPIVTYILVTKPYTRFAIENYVHWGISLVAGAWGMMALGSMRSLALGIHLVLGAMFAAALGAHNNTEFGDLEIRCTTSQQAFIRCATCACAALNTCTGADFLPGGTCPGCTAPTAEFCRSFETMHNKILLAVTGPITVFLMGIPVIFSLLALLKVECAGGLEISNKVAHALAMVNAQMVHLNAHEPIAVPLDGLMGSVRLIEAEGGPGMLDLADQCRTCLARAGFNVGPRGHDSKENAQNTSIAITASPPSVAHTHTSTHSQHSVAQSQYSMTAHAGPSSPAEVWRLPSQTQQQPRPPQPAAMTFPAAGGPEQSIYYPPPHSARRV